MRMRLLLVLALGAVVPMVMAQNPTLWPASQVSVQHSPTNYTAATPTSEDQFVGIDTALGQTTDMDQNEIRMRVSPGTGQPDDPQIIDLQEGVNPAPADSVLGQKDGGDLVRFEMDAIAGRSTIGTCSELTGGTLQQALAGYRSTITDGNAADSPNRCSCATGGGVDEVQCIYSEGAWMELLQAGSPLFDGPNLNIAGLKALYRHAGGPDFNYPANTTYRYISADDTCLPQGSDGNDGATIGTPWRSSAACTSWLQNAGTSKPAACLFDAADMWQGTNNAENGGSEDVPFVTLTTAAMNCADGEDCVFVTGYPFCGGDAEDRAVFDCTGMYDPSEADPANFFHVTDATSESVHGGVAYFGSLGSRNCPNEPHDDGDFIRSDSADVVTANISCPDQYDNDSQGGIIGFSNQCYTSHGQGPRGIHLNFRARTDNNSSWQPACTGLNTPYVNFCDAAGVGNTSSEPWGVAPTTGSMLSTEIILTQGPWYSNNGVFQGDAPTLIRAGNTNYVTVVGLRATYGPNTIPTPERGVSVAAWNLGQNNSAGLANVFNIADVAITNYSLGGGSSSISFSGNYTNSDYNVSIYGSYFGAGSVFLNMPNLDQAEQLNFWARCLNVDGHAGGALFAVLGTHTDDRAVFDIANSIFDDEDRSASFNLNGTSTSLNNYTQINLVRDGQNGSGGFPPGATLTNFFDSAHNNDSGSSADSGGAADGITYLPGQGQEWGLCAPGTECENACVTAHVLPMPPTLWNGQTPAGMWKEGQFSGISFPAGGDIGVQTQ